MATTPVRAEELSFRREGDVIRGFAAWTGRGGEQLPTIVIIPDVHGLSDHYRDIAQRFATAGFFSYAIDLYSREGRPQLADPNAVREWISQLDDRRVLADIDGAVKFLRSRVEVRKQSVGITGFCIGGQYALMSACTVADVSACASFYGMLRYAEHNEKKPASPLELAPNLGCAYLGLFGADDPLIPRDDVRELEAILKKHGKNFRIKTYSGAGHAFFNDRRPDAYRPEAARDAWQQVIAFFGAELGVH